MTLEAEYKRLCVTPSDIYLHLPRFVDLVDLLDAKHVIELGTRTGVSTVAWLYALAQNDGHLTSVDIDVKPAVDDYPHWTYVQGDDVDPDVVSALQPADIVFIDTSHHYHHTVDELNIYRWLVTPGGVLCGHDSELMWPEGAPYSDGPFPVKRAVQEFVKANGYDVEFIHECYGFWIVRGF